MFNGADYLILVIATLSGLIGLWRGFAKEFLSLVNWVLAVGLSYFFYRPLGQQFPLGETADWIRDSIAAVLIFLCTLLAGSMIISGVKGLVRASGLTGTDRTLGLVFGFARAACVLLVLLLFLPKVSPIAEQQWWQNSTLIPMFLEFEDWALEVHQNLVAWLNQIVGRTS